MIQDPITGLFYEPSNINTNENQYITKSNTKCDTNQKPPATGNKAASNTKYRTQNQRAEAFNQRAIGDQISGAGKIFIKSRYPAAKT